VCRLVLGTLGMGSRWTVSWLFGVWLVLGVWLVVDVVCFRGVGEGFFRFLPSFFVFEILVFLSWFL
jgi:hypothetical protein